MFDTSTEFGSRVARRLEEEQVIWFTTVRADLTPQPTPVWFLWDGETFLIFSRPQAQKLRNIERNPKVALNLDSDGLGGNIVVLWGEASIDVNGPSANEIAAYGQKYQAGFARIGVSREDFTKSYSVAIRVTPTHLRGH
ncbi:MAG: TIGR03667 family PPOX class F420-dependent oxidoreductase [Ardenticatenaceae bacterium]|nr:TIGR03667 family PPOX class F420-dependent oxidoreductase [Ardenticatenaceae bacterium]HBY92678.1 TIGR03667 family PPOX class F420-dependent oxidoreductase [Chloroflexota bacterium]